MKHIEKLNWHDVIIEDKKGTDIKTVKKTIDWYRKVMSKKKDRNENI